MCLALHSFPLDRYLPRNREINVEIEPLFDDEQNGVLSSFLRKLSFCLVSDFESLFSSKPRRRGGGDPYI